MGAYINIFTTREIAIIVWVAVFIIWFLSQKNIRLSILSSFKVFLKRQIIIPFSSMFLYVASVVYLFSQIQLWESAFLKDTIFWLLGTATVLFMNTNNVQKDKLFFRKIVSDNSKLVLVLIFIINFYTFHLLIELIMIPLIFIIIMMNAVAGLKTECLPVKKATDFIIAVWGIFIAVFTITSALSDYQNLWTANNIHTFLLPLLLTFAFLPFLYGFAIFLAYDAMFVRLNNSVGKQDKTLLKIAKRKLFKTFGLNLSKLSEFSKRNTGKLWGLRSEDELTEMIKEFEN